ncbi:SHOCT domain-containing protein [Sphingomonas bacterium]|uniref:SHOCT domain-containing protein n=1 Tax=Sphingomonas bacterium TaxID=1895847 RepID=UPI0026314FD8|nr:SHOCT domain-containing protein [Sphingomonas bacterium]MDB5678358.1 hypothetical protein [Sphingomonas bacterium]
MSDITEELGRLADLRDRGVLTQEEFDQQKAMLLNPPTGGAAPPKPAPDPVASPTPAVVAAPVATEQGTKPRPPGYAPPTPGSKTALFVIIGVGGLIVILLALWAAGVFRSSRTTMTSTNSGTMFSNLSAPVTSATSLASSDAVPAPVAPAVADDSWLMGQWENVAAPSCAQWMRFGTDHSLGDNASGSGTWSLVTGPGDGYTLSMNITGTGLREGPIVRDESAGTITMGAAPNTITWRKTTC